jgi:hypothetical protein
MTPDRDSLLQTRRAMYRAALAAQIAGEPYVNGDRIAAALLRTDGLREFCLRAAVNAARVLEMIGDAPSPSFEDCEQRAKNGPALQFRPLEPLLKPVFDAVLERESQLAISPLALLLEILRVHPSLATRLAPHGLTPEAILTDMDKENA